METITSLNVRAVRLPMQEPHRTASGVITESPLVLIDIETSAGTKGHGLLFTYTVAALAPVKQFIENISALVIGEPLAPTALSDRLHAKFRLLGTQGLVGMSLAGIDMALWDAKARAANSSLVEYLGGEIKPVPIYGGIGYDGVEGSAAAAKAWKDKGVSAVKAKIGYPTIEEEIAVVEAMREVIGDKAPLMVDYNQCLTPQQAIERIEALKPYQLTWVEEPTLAHDYQGHRLIADAVETPIQCGENWWGPLDMQHAIDHRASDFMMPDVMKIGGVTGWMRIATLAQQKGILISSHLWPEVSAQLLCLSPTAHWLEYIDWWNPILESPLVVKDGYAVLENIKGSGVSWNETVAAEYEV